MRVVFKLILLNERLFRTVDPEYGSIRFVRKVYVNRNGGVFQKILVFLPKTFQ